MDSNEFKKHFKELNKGISEVNKEVKQHQKEVKQKSNNSTLTLLTLMSEDMQRHNASEKSIQLALRCKRYKLP
jgi:hypothetical protein